MNQKARFALALIAPPKAFVAGFCNEWSGSGSADIATRSAVKRNEGKRPDKK